MKKFYLIILTVFCSGILMNARGQQIPQYSQYMQTLFVRGTYQGHNIDNTTPQEVSKWINVVKTLMPKEVMVYTISRDTPAAGLRKVSKKELESIASQVRDLNITVSVSE